MDTKFLKNTMNHFDLIDIYKKKLTQNIHSFQGHMEQHILLRPEKTLKSSKEWKSCKLCPHTTKLNHKLTKIYLEKSHP